MGAGSSFERTGEQIVMKRHADHRRLTAAIPEEQRIPGELGMDGFDVLELVVEFQDSLTRAER